MKKNNSHYFFYPLNVVLLLLSGTLIPLHAADSTMIGHRPKIGLALSGGGVRGAAHIGVLKVLKELRIPIDYIAGTSAGAAVGGFYASGMPVEDIERLITKTDWKDVFNDRPSRQYRSFRRKEEDNEHLMYLELGFNHGKITMPRGLIAGQKLSFMLKSATLPVSNIHDFDSLAIPFRAVATDIKTGEEAVLSKGNLAEAIRASMSVPGVFSPVEMDGRTLVDGGIVKNLPVDILRKMGADVIIAVDIGTPVISDPEKLRSVLGISVQIINILMQTNIDQQTALLTEKDLLIKPELGDISSSDIPRTAETVRKGEIGAQLQKSKLIRYSVSSSEYADFLIKQKTRRSLAVQIDSIKLGQNLQFDPRVSRRLQTQVCEKLDLEILKDDLNRIYELGDFEQVDFDIIEEGNVRTLVVDAKRKIWGPNYLRFGLTLSSNLAGESSFNLIANYNMTHLNALGAEWKHQLQIGETPRYFSEFYQPLNYAGFLFVAPQVYAERYSRDLYDNQYRLATYQVNRIISQIDAGLAFSNLGQLRLGILRGRARGNPIVGSSSLGKVIVDFAGYRGRLKFDTEDNPAFPHKGWVSLTEIYFSKKNLGADSSYRYLRTQFTKLFTYDRHTFATHVQAGTNMKTVLPFYDAFQLGGLFTMSGYHQGQIFGQKYGFGGLVYYYRLGDPFGNGLYVGASAETGNVWNTTHEIRSNNLKFSHALFVGLDTMVGPLYLAYGQSRNNKILYLVLGKPSNI
jgi:NTE family protein